MVASDWRRAEKTASTPCTPPSFVIERRLGIEQWIWTCFSLSRKDGDGEKNVCSFAGV